MIDPRFRPFLDTGLDDCPQAMAWSGDGRLLAVGGVGGGVVVLDVESGLEQARWQAHDGGLFSLGWQPGKHRLVTSGQDGCARVWQLATDRFDQVCELRQRTDWAEHCAWQPSGRLLAVAAGRQVNVYETDGKVEPDGKLLREYTFPDSTIAAIAWRPSGAQLALAGYNSVWVCSPLDPRTSPNILRWRGSMISVAWNPAGSVIATGCQDSTVHFWRLRDGDNSQMTGYETKPRQLAWSAGGEWLATDGSSDVTLWSFRKPGPEGMPPVTLRMHRKAVKSLAFAPKGNLLLSGCAGGTICLWDKLEDFVPPLVVQRSESSVEQLAWHPAVGKKMFAAASADGDVCIYTVPTIVR